jgi:hypothetical protein
MTKLLVKNKKIAKSANDTYTLYNYGIPAYVSKTGKKTCPMAGQCAKGCYAQAGAYVWPVVAAAYEYRLAASLSDTFQQQIETELAPKVKTAKRQGKQLVIRIHDSGDFYDIAYLMKWIDIMEANPSVLFYAYTKMVPMFKRLASSIPKNFTVILSEGGLADSKIDAVTDRHSRVFSSLQELVQAGYDDASNDDTVAFNSLTGKIGLVYHGVKSKAWETA